MKNSGTEGENMVIYFAATTQYTNVRRSVFWEVAHKINIYHCIS